MHNIRKSHASRTETSRVHLLFPICSSNDSQKLREASHSCNSPLVDVSKLGIFSILILYWPMNTFFYLIFCDCSDILRNKKECQADGLFNRRKFALIKKNKWRCNINHCSFISVNFYSRLSKYKVNSGMKIWLLLWHCWLTPLTRTDRNPRYPL